MKKKVFTALMFALTVPTAFAQSPATEHAAEPRMDETRLQHGKELYQYWCAACHAAGPGHPGTQALAARYGDVMPAALEERNNLTPALIEVFVRNGISIMPFFRKTEISDDELAAIGAYLSRTPAEQSLNTQGSKQ